MKRLEPLDATRRAICCGRRALGGGGSFGALWLLSRDRLAVRCSGACSVVRLSVEHWRYKPVSARTPEQGWVATNERFVDPESGQLITVYYQPSTGERRYVSS